MYLHLIRFLLVLLNLNYFFSLGGWGGGEGNTRKYVTYCLLGGIFFLKYEVGVISPSLMDATACPLIPFIKNCESVVLMKF